jgi:hypothetical protein
MTERKIRELNDREPRLLRIGVNRVYNDHSRAAKLK